MTPIQSAQEYVDSGCCCDQFSKEHIVALIAECERLEQANTDLITTLRLKARRKDEFDPSMEILKL